jgi:hypothetical protein
MQSPILSDGPPVARIARVFLRHDVVKKPHTERIDSIVHVFFEAVGSTVEGL